MSQVELLKQKAKEEQKNRKSFALKYHAYDVKTGKTEIKERVIRSGKEGNSLKRIAIVLTLILLELIFLIFLYIKFIQAFLWFIFMPYGISIIFSCRVAVGTKNDDSKIAWIMFLLIMAPIAFIVYLLAGEMTSTPLKARKLKRISDNTKILPKMNMNHDLSQRIKQDAVYIQNTSDYVPYYNSETEYFPTGESFFDDVFEKIKSAKEFIFLEFFILEEGYLTNALLEILKEKAALGVDVRIICDGLGSHSSLSFLKINKMRHDGIKMIAFEPVFPILSFFINYRDHRKIIIIDGKIGYVGGTNVADEYINAKNKHGNWKDASLRIDGLAVNSLLLMFLRMWEYSSNEKTDYGRFLNCKNHHHETSQSVIIPYADGPSEKHKVGKGVYANIIANAQNSLYIMTPYFIVDNTITDLLKAKAQSGVDVRIIIPGIPDKKIVYALTVANTEKLMKSGVKVYLYTPGFIHSKVMASDDECAVVGSINMDFRSFYQQYESAVYLSEKKTITQITSDFHMTFSQCHEITAENRKKRNLFIRIALAFLRLFSPLM